MYIYVRRTVPLRCLSEAMSSKTFPPCKMELKKAGEFTAKRIEEQVVGTRPKRLNRFEFEGPVAGTKVKSLDYILRQKRLIWLQGLVVRANPVVYAEVRYLNTVTVCSKP